MTNNKPKRKRKRPQSKKTATTKNDSIKKIKTTTSSTKKTTTKKKTTKKLEPKEVVKKEVVEEVKSTTSPKKKNTKKVTTSKTIKKVESKKEEIILPKEKIKEEAVKPKIEVVEESKIEEVSKEKITNDKEQPTKKKTKRKSNAKKIARSKTNELIAKLEKLRRRVKIYGIQSIIPKHQIAVILCGLIILYGIYFGLSKLFSPTYVKIDLDSVSSDIDQLKTVKFDIDQVDDVVSSSKCFSDSLKDYYEYDYESVFNLNKEWLDSSNIKYSKSTKEIFIAYKASENNEDNVKNSIENFLKTNGITSYENFEYDNYTFYIKASSTDNTKLIISKIKQIQIRVFDILVELNKDDINTTYGIESSLYDSYLSKKSMVSKTNTTEYLIIRPKNKSAKETIINKMNEYYDKQKEKWTNDNNQTNLLILNSRVEKEYNGYLIFVVSRDNDLVLQLITK